MEVYVPGSNLTFTSAIVKENGSRSRFDEENMPSGPNKRLLKDRYQHSSKQKANFLYVVRRGNFFGICCALYENFAENFHRWIQSGWGGGLFGLSIVLSESFVASRPI